MPRLLGQLLSVSQTSEGGYGRLCKKIALKTSLDCLLVPLSCVSWRWIQREGPLQPSLIRSLAHAKITPSADSQAKFVPFSKPERLR